MRIFFQVVLLLVCLCACKPKYFISYAESIPEKNSFLAKNHISYDTLDSLNIRFPCERYHWRQILSGYDDLRAESYWDIGLLNLDTHFIERTALSLFFKLDAARNGFCLVENDTLPCDSFLIYTKYFPNFLNKDMLTLAWLLSPNDTATYFNREDKIQQFKKHFPNTLFSSADWKTYAQKKMYASPYFNHFIGIGKAQKIDFKKDSALYELLCSNRNYESEQYLVHIFSISEYLYREEIDTHYYNWHNSPLFNIHHDYICVTYASTKEAQLENNFYNRYSIGFSYKEGDTLQASFSAPSFDCPNYHLATSFSEKKYPILKHWNINKFTTPTSKRKPK
jgi:hypothetical protein